MGRTIELSLTGAVALQSASRGIWIADRGSRSLVCFDADRANEVARIALQEAPVALAAAEGFLAAGLDSGVIAAFDASTGAALWRRALGSSNMLLRSGGDYVWAAERDGAALVSFDRSGAGSRVLAKGLHLFAPAAEGVFWLSRDGVLVSQRVSEGGMNTALLSEAEHIGSMAACANALWLSAAKRLLLVDQRSLTVRTSIEAPEGPVPHLICEDNKLVGGLNGVFVLNPMADARVHPLPIEPASSLRAIAATPSKVWALESARPAVHIADLI